MIKTKEKSSPATTLNYLFDEKVYVMCVRVRSIELSMRLFSEMFENWSCLLCSGFFSYLYTEIASETLDFWHKSFVAMTIIIEFDWVNRLADTLHRHAKSKFQWQMAVAVHWIF